MLVKRIIEGTIEGKNHRGRPRFDYMKQLKVDMNCTSYCELKRKAEKREEWQAAPDQPMVFKPRRDVHLSLIHI